MKRSLVLILSVIVCFGAGAQSAHQPGGFLSNHRSVLNALLAPQKVNERIAAAKTTSGISSERVIAQSTRDNTLATLNDSLNLKYRANGSSLYDYNTMLYPYNYPYSTTPMFNYAGTFTKPQVLCDTLRHWTVDPNTLVYGLWETDLANYNALMNLTDYKALYVDSALIHNKVYANTFNTANNITLGYTSNWIGGATDSAFKQYFTYNAFNKLVKDSTYELHLGVWRIVSKTFYTYDVSNNLIQIDEYANTTDTSMLLPLIEQLKYINSFDGTNRLLTVEADYYTGVTLSPYVRDTFAYSGGMTYHNSWKEYQWDAINSYWNPAFYMTKVIGVSGHPDTVLIKGFDSLLNAWVPQIMDVMHYNTSNDPDTLKDYEYNFTSYPSTPSFTTIYYYEPYTMTLGLDKVVLHPDNARVFPNPANNMVTITGLNAPLNSIVSIAIVDVSGRIHYRETHCWNGATQISLRDLTPGTYWLAITDASGKTVHHETIVKQ
jgi:Secretion system C-terminal sorting domain